MGSLSMRVSVQGVYVQWGLFIGSVWGFLSRRVSIHQSLLGSLSGCPCPQGLHLGGFCAGGLCLGLTVNGVSVWGLCPGDGSVQVVYVKGMWSLSRRISLLVVSVQWGLFMGLCLHFLSRRFSIRGSLSRGSLYGGLCKGDIYPEGLCPVGSLSRGGSLSMRVSCPGEGSLSSGVCSGALCLGFLSRRVSICQSLSLVSMSRGGDLCPGWGLIPESLSREVCPWGSLVISVQEGLYQDPVQGVSI